MKRSERAKSRIRLDNLNANGVAVATLSLGVVMMWIAWDYMPVNYQLAPLASGFFMAAFSALWIFGQLIKHWMRAIGLGKLVEWMEDNF